MKQLNKLIHRGEKMKRINRRNPAFRDPNIEIPENPLEREFYENELAGSDAYFIKKEELEKNTTEPPKRVCKKFYENAIYGNHAYERNREIEKNWKNILNETKNKDDKNLEENDCD